MLDWGVQGHHQKHDHDHYQQQQQQQGCRKGPWTLEEDNLLAEYVTLHGEGRWSTVAKCAGNYFDSIMTSIIYIELYQLNYYANLY